MSYSEIHKNVMAHRVPPSELQTEMNSILDIASGTFTPTFTFATPGDLSVSYATRVGRYWRIGSILHFVFDVAATPTFTTATDEALISGLPFSSSDIGVDIKGSVQLSGSGITWPTGRTATHFAVLSGLSTLRLQASGTGVGISNFQSSNFSSGSALAVRGSGFFPI